MAASVLTIYRNYSDSDTTLNQSYYGHQPLPEFSVFGWDTPEGKAFKEYNTSRDGTGTSYSVGDRVYDEAPILYLIWEGKCKLLDKTGLTYLWSKIKGVSGHADRSNGLLYGSVDSTSTSTSFTATVDGLNSLYNGVTVLLRNGVVTSASGFTLNVNGLGALPVYNSLATGNDITPTEPTRETTIFNINYTMMFIYIASDVVDGGCWIAFRGYDSNTNTIGYQLRTNNSNMVASDTGYRYRIWFTSADGSKWVPANTSTSTNATSTRTLNTRKIDPFGRISYNATNGTVNSGARPSNATMWNQITLTIGYSYAKSMTAWKPVYVKCTPQADGSAVMVDIVQALPTSDDGFIYIFLGTAYSTTAMELLPVHPVYWHDGTGIRLWTGSASSGATAMTDTEINTAVDNAFPYQITKGTYIDNVKLSKDTAAPDITEAVAGATIYVATQSASIVVSNTTTGATIDVGVTKDGKWGMYKAFKFTMPPCNITITGGAIPK